MNSDEETTNHITNLSEVVVENFESHMSLLSRVGTGPRAWLMNLKDVMPNSGSMHLA